MNVFPMVFPKLPIRSCVQQVITIVFLILFRFRIGHAKQGVLKEVVISASVCIKLIAFLPGLYTGLIKLIPFPSLINADNG